jgi:branched-chain amino acid transport system ATP-binding protein
VLEAEGIVKRFGGLLAGGGASRAVREGEIVALIGPNGAGKTTLFSIVAGFERPDEGSIRFEGAEIGRLAPHAIAARGLVRTFQIVQPFAGLSVRENIAVGAHLHEGSRRAALAAAEAVARRVGLADRLDQPAQNLTIAGRKRLELARALATRPKLLLLDEVMAGLNPAEIEAIVGIVHAIRAGGVTILLTEHVMEAVTRLAERVYVLSQGRIIAEGAPAAVTADPAVIEAYLGHGAAIRLEGGRRA